MRIHRAVTAVTVLCLVASGCRSAATSARPQFATSVARGVDLIRGEFVPGTQPDGNSIILHGKGGLVVVDTGRHESHTRKIIDYAHSAGVPVVAVINTHWHLDHIGGNALLRREFPNVRIYASGALDEAMHGFLAKYRGDLEAMIAKSPDDAEAQKGFRAELAILDSGRALYPDETITRSETRKIAGRTFDVHLETDTVTAGDVWLVDPATGVVVTGDLVTLPAPFLDTACPARWKAALDRLAALNFEVLVPGHGPIMSKQDFLTYRGAFDGLLTCAASAQAKDACIDGWLRDAAPLVSESEKAFTRQLIGYYVENVLRGDPVRTAKLCGGQ